MATHNIGKIYVELDLDADRYTKGQQKLLKDAQQTTLNIEQNFKNLGIKSAAEMDLMRAKITNSYNLIANSAKSTANDKIRAEEAYHAQLKRLNDTQFGQQTSMIDNLKSHWIAASAIIYAAWGTINTAWDMAKAGAAYKEQSGILDNLARKYSTSADDIVDSMQKASDGLVAKADLMQIALAGLGKGLDPQQLINLADAARILGDVAGKDATTALRDLTEALETGRTKGLKNYLGTTLDLEAAFGDLTSKLTAAEKAQAMYNITMDAATGLQSQMTKEVDSASDRIEHLEATWKNLKLAIGNATNSYIDAMLKMGQGDMSYAGLSPGGMGTGLQGDPKARERSPAVKSSYQLANEQLKKELQNRETARAVKTSSGKTEKSAAQIAHESDLEAILIRDLGWADMESEAIIAAKKAETEATIEEARIEQERFNNLVDMYGIELQLQDEVGKKTKESFDGIKMSIEASSGALADFVMTGKMDFKSFADSIIRDFVRIQIQQSLTYAATGGKEGGGGWIGSALSLIGLFNEKGNVFDSGRLQPFARGGIIDRPTIFPMANGAGLMGEAGPEAVMPLTRGSDGKLGVKAKGGDGNGEGVTNIIIQAVDAKSFEDMCKRNPAAITGPILQSLRDNKTRTEFKRLVN